MLCVANFPANTGFAWSFIERIYADAADRLAETGVTTWVAYPEIDDPPRTLDGSAAKPLLLDVELDDPGSLAALLKTIRTYDIGTVYLSDRPSWHPAYSLLRAAGVQRVVVHDHTSGARTAPSGAKRILKSASRRLPGMLADRVIAVSDYVARRKIDVDLVPPDRVVRLWNGVPDFADSDRGEGALTRLVGSCPEGPVVACACRAAPEKGVACLLRAFDRASTRLAGSCDPVLLYMGSGPSYDQLEELRSGLSCADSVVFAGYRKDARQLIACADVAVVPSLWEEAFGLSALEPMAAGVPVIASNVGGIPEVVADGETGLLVPPGDVEALADALCRLLADRPLRQGLGDAGRRRARKLFGWDDMMDRVVHVLQAGDA